MILNKDLFSESFGFIADTTAFNWTNAYACAMVSYLAYANEKIIKNQIEKVWNAKCRFITVKGTQAFVMTTDTIIIVAFRGTEPDQIEDWLTDLNLDFVDGPMRGKVHDGFYTSLNDVWRKIERTISGFRQNKEKSLWITGHSLGGALATLAVARLRDQDRPVDGLYTFGQPRTGDCKFTRNFNADFKEFSFRYVNNNDLVTRIPPRSLKYSHVGTFRYFDEQENYHEDICKWNRFLDRMRGRIDDALEWGSDGIKDHNMEIYLKRIREQLDKTKESH